MKKKSLLFLFVRIVLLIVCVVFLVGFVKYFEKLCSVIPTVTAFVHVFAILNGYALFFSYKVRFLVSRYIFGLRNIGNYAQMTQKLNSKRYRVNVALRSVQSLNIMILAE